MKDAEFTIWKEGADAARDSQPLDANPYSDEGDYQERVKFRLWRHGWEHVMQDIDPDKVREGLYGGAAASGEAID